MADDIDIITDMDMFFYYGQNDLSLEIKSDVYLNVVQPAKSLFYSRDRNSAGVERFENNPNTVALRIMIPFSVVNSLAKRNLDVSADNPNRQIAISQQTVTIQQNNNEVDLNIEYLPLYNWEKSDTLSVRI